MNLLRTMMCKVLPAALALTLAGTVFTSCREEEPPFLILDQDSLVASPEDARFVIDVKSNVSWTASSTADWVKVFGENGDYKGSFEVLLAANKTAGTRTAEIIVTGDGCTATVSVIQTSGELSLVVPVKEYTAGKDASEVTIKYIVSAPDALVEAFTTADWLSVKSVADGNVKVAVAKNESGEVREAGVKIVATDANSKSVVSETLIRQAENILEVLVDSLSVSPLGEVVRIPVITESEVKVSCTSDWCSASFSDGSVVVTALKNETNMPRTAVVSIALTAKGTALSKTFKVSQWPVTIDSDQLKILVPEFRVEAEGTKTVIPFSAKTTVTVRSNTTWCAVTLKDSDIIAEISSNEDSGKDREAYVTITTKDGVSGTVHIIQSGVDNSDSLELLVAETEFPGDGGEIKIPFSYDSESISVRVSSDWLGAVVEDNDVHITARDNWSGNTRKGYVALQTADGTAGVITVIQTSLQPQFLFSTEEVKFTSAAAESYVNITSTGAWKLNNTEAQLPGWISIDPTSGDGDCIVKIAVTGNKFATDRSIELSFTNTDHKINGKIAVAQAANPQGISDYMYLGKGYDASGNYAEDQYVKSSVLDCDAMAADDCISDIINMNQSIEQYIRGKTLEEYEKNYTVEAGISGEYGNKLYGFQGSIKTNFSSKALGSSEHSFITFRHVTKKQILKINENEDAASLMAYRSEGFVRDLSKLDAASLVKKYGTHVVMGFSTGGVIDYSMAADVSKMSSSTDLSVAVKAGFEKKAIGKVSTEDSYNMYQSIQNESNGFEYKLLCRGGESQYTSAGFASDAQAASAYENWLSSLEDSSKWVMVDYEGNQLLPLWMFIEDETLSAAVKTISEQTLSGTGIKQTSSYKNFEFKFVGASYIGQNRGDNFWQFVVLFNLLIDNEPVRVIDKDNYEDIYDYQGDLTYPTMFKDNNFVFRMADYGMRVPTSGVFSMSKFKNHTVVIQFSQYAFNWNMMGVIGALLEDDGGYNLTLTCPADSNIWTYRDQYNVDHSFKGGADGIVKVNISDLPAFYSIVAAEYGTMADGELNFEITW